MPLDPNIVVALVGGGSALGTVGVTQFAAYLKERRRLQAEPENTEAETEWEIVKKHYDKLSDEVGRLFDEVTELREKNSKLRDDLDALRSTNFTLRQELEIVKQSESKLRARVSELENPSGERVAPHKLPYTKPWDGGSGNGASD